MLRSFRTRRGSLPSTLSVLWLLLELALPQSAAAGVLDKTGLLEAETFWDNRDWDWYIEHIPFFECPNAGIQTIYYYRWELVTKHLTYGSPASGYTFTEFIDRPFWSGAYGAISCPAGHQLYEVRWLRRKRIPQDFARYWFRTPGAEPRRYSTWLADSVWALHRVHPDGAFTRDLLPDLVENYEAWERSHFVPEVGLYWQTGHDDGMETNINSRQTKDSFRGAPGFRPTLNSYMWADALAIAHIARLAGEEIIAARFTAKAAALRENLQEKLWDPEREFFFHMYRDDEEKDGHTIRALSLTYQTGKHAGSQHGRELIGYVPWQFSLPEPGFEAAWRFLMDPDYFFAEYGPTVTERHDPLFLISVHCCVWSGQSWPYATTQTLKAMANLLQESTQEVVSKKDYFRLLEVYTRTHRKDGRPYIAEAAHPDTGSWNGHDATNHSEHYFHSGYADLIVTGLVGLRPRDDCMVEVAPLAPDDWDYFALDDVSYRGHRLSIVWDRDGTRYGLGAGLRILAGGAVIASAPKLERLIAELPGAPAEGPENPPPANYAANNDGHYFPRVTASFHDPGAPIHKVHDGNYWYHRSPPNRFTYEGSPNPEDWIEIDLGAPRRIHTVKLYFLDDGPGRPIAPPRSLEIESWDAGGWKAIPGQERTPSKPEGRCATSVRFPPLEVQKLRATVRHREGAFTGLTEIEAWGDLDLPYRPPRPPPGNLALRSESGEYPKVRASWTSRFDRLEHVHDGRTVYSPSPHNRWTSYESPGATDWLEIDFGEAKEIGRVVLHIYDDRGGVQPPESYAVEYLAEGRWHEAAGQEKTPSAPAGGALNTVRFETVRAEKVRVVFRHRGKARTGLTEIEVWRK